MATKLRVLLAIGPALLVLLSVAEVLRAPDADWLIWDPVPKESEHDP